MMRRLLAFLPGVVSALVLLPACSAGDELTSRPPSTGPDETTTVPGTTSTTTTTETGSLPTSSDAFGANVVSGGVTFRVWAPHADAASVVGDFAGGTVAMEATSEGVFERTVASAEVGTIYHFRLETAGGALDRIDPYCRQLTADKSACLVVDPSAYEWKSAAFTAASRQTSVVYELHVGSFAVAEGAAHGTFASTAARLADLAELGINVVELMPVQHYGGKPNGWGYNPQLFFAPKTSYGSADELRALVDGAHGLGLGVWLDTVVNHTDGWTEAPLFCFDGLCPDGSAGLYFFPPGTYAKTPWGPRPFFTEPRVKGMLLDATTQWLTEFRGDGFRWDSTSNIRAIDGQGTTPGGHELLVEANALAHAAGALSVAEDLKGEAALTKPASAGGFGFDAQWDGFGYDIMAELAKQSDDARDLNVVEGALKGTYSGDPFARLLFIEDHDTVGNNGWRLPNRIDMADPTSYWARKRSMLGGVLLLTAPGIPMLFMGQEALATGTFESPPPAVDALANPTPEGEEMRAFYTDMIRLRRNLDGKSGGLSDPEVEVFHKNDAGKVIAYRRHGASGEDVLVIVNLRNKLFNEYDVGVAGSGTWRLRLDTDRKVYGADFGDDMLGDLTTLPIVKDGKPYTLRVRLGPYSAVVITR